MQIERIIAKGQLVPLIFSQVGVTASQTAVAMKAEQAAGPVSNTVDQYVMPFDFEIIAVSARTDVARTAGTATFTPTKNTTAVTTPKAVLDATNTQNKQTTTPRETNRGVAGDRVGCNVDTPAGWTPVAANVIVVVWVLLYLDNI